MKEQSQGMLAPLLVCLENLCPVYLIFKENSLGDCRAWCSAISWSAAKGANQESMDHVHTTRDTFWQVD